MNNYELIKSMNMDEMINHHIKIVQIFLEHTNATIDQQALRAMMQLFLEDEVENTTIC